MSEVVANPFDPTNLDFADFDTSDLDDTQFLNYANTDPLWFLQVCAKIVDKQTKRLRPFVLNKEQKEVFDAFWYLWNQQKPVRLIILKARQMGISTLFEGLGYWMVTTRAHCKGLVLAHEKATSAHVFQMADRFRINDSRNVRGLMPAIRRANQGELVFDNPNTRNTTPDPGLDSALTIATADNRNAGHGWTGSFLHCTEVARWPSPECLAGVLNALTEAPYTLGVMESTAYGASGVFYETWHQAVAGQNGWTPIFLSWKGRPEYTASMTQKELDRFEPTNEELELMKRHGLTIPQVQWRRQKIAGPECQGQERDPVSVFQEQYPLDPDEAFVSSGTTFFDQKAVKVWSDRSKDRERESPPERGYLDMVKLSGPVKPDRLTWKPDNNGPIRVWQLPREGEDYLIGADVAAGHHTGDWSQAYVIHRRTLRVDASYRAHVHPDKYAAELIALAWYYNRAFLSVEANAVGMETARIVARNYSRSAYKVRLDEIAYGEQDGEKPGWYTTPTNRKELFWTLRNAIRDSVLLDRETGFACYDTEFWKECKSFVIPTDERTGRLKEDQPRAAIGRHDDCVAALAIAVKCNDPFIAGPVIESKQVFAPKMSERERWLDDDMQRESSKRRTPKLDYDDDVGSY